MNLEFFQHRLKSKGRILLIAGLGSILLFSLMACGSNEEPTEEPAEEMDDMDMDDMDMDMGDGPDVHSEVTEGDLTIRNAWGRPGFTGDNTGVYLIIENAGSEVETLLTGESEVAGATEFHQMIMENDIMSMKPVSENLQIPAGGQLELKSGSYHVMLIDLQKDLNVGDEFVVMLNFEINGMIMITVKVSQS